MNEHRCKIDIIRSDIRRRCTSSCCSVVGSRTVEASAHANVRLVGADSAVDKNEAQQQGLKHNVDTMLLTKQDMRHCPKHPQSSQVHKQDRMSDSQLADTFQVRKGRTKSQSTSDRESI